MYVGAFGPITWDVMLLCALNYPPHPTEDKRMSMLHFILGLVSVLPCDGCGIHALKYIRQHPPDVSSSDALVRYIITFHNVVNAETGKRTYTVEEAKKALFERYFVDGEEMTRAQRMRKEDCIKIEEMQKKIDMLESKQNIESDLQKNIELQKHLLQKNIDLIQKNIEIDIQKKIESDSDCNSGDNIDRIMITCTLSISIIAIILIIYLCIKTGFYSS